LDEGTVRARLLVADDHAFMRAGIKAIIATTTDLEVVGEAEDGLEALAKCREVSFDLVLMDLSMPNMGGIEATRRMKEICPKTVVLMLTAHEDEGLMLEAVRAGAAGYVLKNSPPAQLLGSVREALAGESPLDPRLAGRLLRRLARDEASPNGLPPEAIARREEPKGLPPPALSARELEVLGHVVAGKPNRLIAQELHVSLSTVKRHYRGPGATKRYPICAMASGLGRGILKACPTYSLSNRAEEDRGGEPWITSASWSNTAPTYSRFWGTEASCSSLVPRSRGYSAITPRR